MFLNDYRMGENSAALDKSEMERDESWNEGVNTAANIKIYHITWIQNNNKAIPQTSLTFLYSKNNNPCTYY